MSHNSHSSHSRHAGSSGDDLGSTDEVKVFKDEGDREDENISSENLLVEEKSSLIDLTETEVSWNLIKQKGGKAMTRPDHGSIFTKLEPHPSGFNMGYLVSPHSYANAGTAGLPVSMANKIGLPPFFCHNSDSLTTPPPAHCGIPPYQLDPKAMGLSRPAIYPFPAGQYAYPMLTQDMPQVPSWHTPSMYSTAPGFRSPYPSSLPINTTLSSDFSFRFSPSLLSSVHTSPHHVFNAHPALGVPERKHDIGQDSSNQRYDRNLDQKSSPGIQGSDCKPNSKDKNKTHIKKPLNAFMLYMKEMRAKVVAECTLKESAAINQILGRRWHELSREEQSKYYEKARQERQLHMELYPEWSARDNYGYVSKKKKRKKDRSPADPSGNNMKKCRARFGLDQQNQWCKPCRRKKKCIRYMEVDGEDQNDGDTLMTDDNLGSCGSFDDAKTPEEDSESLNQSMSSPGCFSALSSIQSPSTSLASPINLLASPSTSNVVHNNGCNSSSASNSTTPAISSSCQGGSNVTSASSSSSDIYFEKVTRSPVGANPRDVNNPLSINQLTKRDSNIHNNNSQPMVLLQQQQQQKHGLMGMQQQHNNTQIQHDVTGISRNVPQVNSFLAECQERVGNKLGALASSILLDKKPPQSLALSSSAQQVVDSTALLLNSQKFLTSQPSLSTSTAFVSSADYQHSHQQLSHQQPLPHQHHAFALSQHLQHLSHHLTHPVTTKNNINTSSASSITASNSLVGKQANVGSTGTTTQHRTSDGAEISAITVT